MNPGIITLAEAKQLIYQRVEKVILLLTTLLSVAVILMCLATFLVHYEASKVCSIIAMIMISLGIFVVAVEGRIMFKFSYFLVFAGIGIVAIASGIECEIEKDNGLMVAYYVLGSVIFALCCIGYGLQSSLHMKSKHSSDITNIKAPDEI